jgi:hypothetical protein
MSYKLFGYKDFPVKSYEVTNNEIDNCTIALERAFNVINSCKYQEQIDNARNFIANYERLFPFAIIIHRALKLKIEKKYKSLPTYDLNNN